MNGQWEGGKGDKSRVSDLKTYGDNYDQIFGKNKPIKQWVKDYQYPTERKYLFLDDNRKPETTWVHESRDYLLNVTKTKSLDWKVVRSYGDFVDQIKNGGIPDVVTFDNDLTEAHMKAYVNEVLAGVPWEWENQKEMGIHCALFLVSECERLGVELPECHIHTANEFARPVLKKILNKN
jgi:hypothetical protein